MFIILPNALDCLDICHVSTGNTVEKDRHGEATSRQV